MKFKEINDPRLFVSLLITGPPNQQITIKTAEKDPTFGGRVVLFMGCSDTWGRLMVTLPRTKFLVCSNLMGETMVDVEAYDGKRVYEMKSEIVQSPADLDHL